MRTTAFLSICLLAVLAVPAQAGLAQAGQLFPPQNIGANPNVKCPSGKVLTWNVDHVDCVDPTAGVTFACPAGQVLTSIQNGQPVCLVLASGGGGITGGCTIFQMASNTGATVKKQWGKGCLPVGTTKTPTTTPEADIVCLNGYGCGQRVFIDACVVLSDIANGYSCGTTSSGDNAYDGWVRCGCIRP